MRGFLAAIIISAFAITISSCGKNFGPTGPESSSSQTVGVIPAGAIVDSAHLMLHVSEPGGLTVIVHPQTSAWNEAAVTWSDVGDGLSPFVMATLSGADTGWVSIDVAGLVSLWRDGAWANDGIILDQNAPEFQRTSFHSREAPGFGPKLMLYCSSDSCPVHILTSTGDSYVRRDMPGTNFGADTVLATGWTPSDTGEHRSLIQFDMNQQQALARIGSRVWYDGNGNGIQDAGEEGIPEVAVLLWNCADSMIAETHTDSAGLYAFDALLPGNYAIQFIAPEHLRFTTPDAGLNDALDSDASHETGRTICFSLGELDDGSWDAGLMEPVAIDPGCTRGKGYWKHQASSSLEDTQVSELLPLMLGHEGGAKTMQIVTAESAFQILQQHTFGHPGNGITKLYAHLLTTKLNIANGASAEDIEETVEAADAFLTASCWEDWALLPKEHRKMVGSWKHLLERYNEGLDGPGACEE